MSTIEVTSPFDGKVVGQFHSVHLKEYNKLSMICIRKLFLDDNWIPKYKRIEILENVMKIMSSQVEELTILLCK